MKDLFIQIAKLAASKYMTTKCAYVDRDGDHDFMHLVLVQLQKRIEISKREDITMEAMVMREAVGDVIHLAYTSYKQFCNEWKLNIHYNTSPETSNIFVFFFSEKKDGGRQYHFRFAGL